MPGRFPTQPDQRRGFLRGLARYTALASLGGIFAVMARNRNRPGDGGACIRRFACGHCPRVQACELPPAEDFRRNT